MIFSGHMELLAILKSPEGTTFRILTNEFSGELTLTESFLFYEKGFSKGRYPEGYSMYQRIGKQFGHSFVSHLGPAGDEDHLLGGGWFQDAQEHG